MEKHIAIKEDYLYLPVCKEQPKRCLEIFCAENSEQEKLFEFQIPVGEASAGAYPVNYYARFPVKQFTDKTLILKGDMPEGFFDLVKNTSMQNPKNLRHPSIHFTAETGWMNDPNGLVYKDGIYHLYFQYNPFDTQWENMSWGHATSEDLLHWEQKDSVLFPDENGTIFSGSGIRNDKGMLGLPADALLFFYTAAGDTNRWSKDKQSIQCMAYSLDGGNTLIKSQKGRIMTVCKENRDPKVFWHDESHAYILVLWLEANDFGIFRSPDLEQWVLSDRITLEKAFECPDLMRLYDEAGNAHWMFWCADGFYYWGEFDGYHFKTDGKCHKAYINEVPYAAQTYSGVEGRTIQIPWFRLPNSNKCYTGAMGLPRELSVCARGEEKKLMLKPVREFEQWKKTSQAYDAVYEDEKIRVTYTKTVDYNQTKENNESKTVFEKMVPCSNEKGVYNWNIEGTKVSYDMLSGYFLVGDSICRLHPNIHEFSFLVDDDIFEVSAECDTIVGAFELKENVGR